MSQPKFISIKEIFGKLVKKEEIDACLADPKSKALNHFEIAVYFFGKWDQENLDSSILVNQVAFKIRWFLWS